MVNNVLIFNQVLSVEEEEIKYNNSIFHENNHQLHVFWRFHRIENEIEADVGNFPSPS